MTAAIMACMRNEAMFVIEWVAYHRLIGFDKVFVCTNNCTDGTDLILDRLDEMGVVHHICNDELNGLAPQPAGVARVLSHHLIADVDWLLHIDADEFLNISLGDGQVSELLALAQGFDAMGLTWRLFGDSHMTEWSGGLIIEQQVLAEAKQTPFSAMHKTFFRPDRFGAGIDHMPKDPVDETIKLCNTRGWELNPAPLYDRESSDLRMARGLEVNRKRKFGWYNACINHYAVRTPDLFLLKNVRGDGIGSRFNKRYFLNSRWHRSANRNDVEDRSIQRHLPALRAEVSRLLDDAVLRAAVAKAERLFRQLRSEHYTPENIAQWTSAPRG